MRKIRLSVPASSANLGPGFDALGMALELRNTLEMRVIEEGLAVEVEGEGLDELPRDDTNLMVKVAGAVFEKVGRRPSGLGLYCVNRIPLRSGLGSSAAAAVGAAAAANALVDGGLSTDELLWIASEWEGHADNAAASLHGGLNLVAVESGEVLVRNVSLPPMRVAVAQPNFGLSTQRMREVLPSRVPTEDAAYNLGHALLTVEALRSGEYNFLGKSMTDRLHQPFRAAHIAGYDSVIEAARRAGAAAVVLSGAGPSLIAFAPGGHERIARAMVEAWAGTGIEARGLALAVATEGVRRE
jgi:homoserine kinase